jgi:hypothetical protein
MLPAAALRGAVADGAEIVLCKAPKVELRAVTVGYRDASRVEIAEGLKAGEKVAVDHVLGLDEEATIVEAKNDKETHGQGGADKEQKDEKK